MSLTPTARACPKLCKNNWTLHLICLGRCSVLSKVKYLHQSTRPYVAVNLSKSTWFIPSYFKDSLKSSTSVTLLCPSILASKVDHRNMAKKKGQKGKQQSYSDDESDEEYSDSDSDDDFPEETDAPDNYKELKTVVPSTRSDIIAAKGLNIPRNKVESHFYAGSLRFNGEKLLKKFKKMEPGDYVDIVDTNGSKVKRVKMMKVGNQTLKENIRVVLRVWKAPFAVEDFLK